MSYTHNQCQRCHIFLENNYNKKTCIKCIQRVVEHNKQDYRKAELKKRVVCATCGIEYIKNNVSNHKKIKKHINAINI